VDLEEICRFAVGSVPVSINEPHFQPVKQPVKATNPSLIWQKRAIEFIQDCEKTLWMPEAQSALDYLHHRGLNDKTISTWHLGYNPNDSFEQLSKWGLEDPRDGNRHSVWLPAGITIPCIVNREIWYIKIRRFEKEPKYINIKGGHPALFGADQLVNNDVAVLTEGEFDAMLLWQEVGDIVGVGTFGSSTNIPDLGIWGQALSSPDLLLAAYDSDEAGVKGQNALMTALNSVVPLQVPVLQPGDKDITDFFLSGGNLRAWALNQVEEILET
jgi:DNA primase